MTRNIGPFGLILPGPIYRLQIYKFSW